MGNVINLFDRKGCLYIGNSNNYMSVKADFYLLCSTYSGVIPYKATLCIEFAPSFDVNFLKQSWLEKQIYKSRFSEFKEIYLKELVERKDFLVAFNELVKMLRNGKKIVLFDSCTLGPYCHLYILKDYLVANGINPLIIGGVVDEP